MPIPRQVISINDPGLGLVEASPTTPLILGTAELGTVDTLYTIGNKNQAVATFGQGQLPEAICHVLDVAGGPVLAMRVTDSVAGTLSAVTAIPIGTATGTITVATTPFDTYDATVEILVSGTVGVATFRYSLDGGDTYSEEIVVPAGATYLMPDTNVTLTFVPGAGPVFFEDGDTHTFTATAPYYTTGDLATAVTALLAVPAATEWAFVILTGAPATAAAGATMFGAVETHAASMAAVFRFGRWIMDAGDDTTAAVQTAFAAVEDARVCVTYGTADTASGKAFAGFGKPAMSLVVNVGARATASLISTDLGRVASGSLVGVTAISHDEYLTETLDAHRITTARTWVGRPGFYLTNGRLKSAPGSDFRYWQHGRIIDEASRETYLYQQLLIGRGVRTNTNGTIDERDALRFETGGIERLRTKLTQPSNAEGNRGHVSEVAYTIDRTNDVLASDEIISEVGARPLGYAKFITTTIGFSRLAEAA